MKYSVWIVSPPGYPHSPGAFMEVAIGLRDGLIELGHEAIIILHPPQESDNCIILGGNLLQYTTHELAPHWIIYNLEQVVDGSPWLKNSYIELLQAHHTVWDYSASNIIELKKLGIQAKLCPIGYVPALSCIPNLEHEHFFNGQPLDVLMYGSMNERRQKVYDQLKHQCNAHWAFGVYGEKRDALIARAKIVVNIHFYESKLFEIVRCSYLMANAKCIVSETGLDKQLETPFYDCIAFSEYADIADRVMALLSNSDERNEYCRKASETFSQMKQSDYLKAVL